MLTVGQLRAAMAGLADDAEVKLDFDSIHDAALEIVESFEAEGAKALGGVLVIGCVEPEDEDEDDDDEEEDNGVPREPEDEDLVTNDYLSFWRHGMGGRKPVVVVAEDDEQPWQVAVNSYMDREQFWPNVWYQGERGDWNLLDATTGEYANS